MSNASKISQINRSIKTRGVLGTLRWIRYGYFRVNKFIVFYKNLTQEFKYEFTDNEIEMRVISLNELKDIRDKEDNLPVEFYCDLTHKFTKPYVSFVQGKIASIHWIVYRGETSRFLNLSKGDVEINYNIVLPEFRRRRLAEALMAFQIIQLKKENMKRVFGVVNANNIPQYKPMLRIGYEPVEILTHFGLKRPKAKLIYVK